MKAIKLLVPILVLSSIAVAAVNALPGSDMPNGSVSLTADVEPTTPNTLPDAPVAAQTAESTQVGESGQTPNTGAPAPSQPVTEEETEPVVEIPVTVTGSVVEYRALPNDPSQQSITCTYSFSDGSVKAKSMGFRTTPGNGVPRLDIECPDWR